MFGWLGYGQSQESEEKENSGENQDESAKSEVKTEEHCEGKESKTSESTGESDLKYAKDVAKNVGSKEIISCITYFDFYCFVSGSVALNVVIDMLCFGEFQLCVT